MKTRWTLLPMAGLLALAPLARPVRAADRTSLVVGDVSGNMHIFQSTPTGCSDAQVDVPVIGGRFDLTPAEGFDVGKGLKRWIMTRGVVSIRPFTIDFSCLGHREHHQYSALSVQVASAVSFLASPSSPGVYRFAIPA